VDPFTIIVASGMVGLIVVILLLGFFHPRSGAEILDWKPTRSAEVEFQNEIDDTEQMIRAQNELRARHGKAPRTTEEIEEEVRRHKEEMDEYSRRYWAEEGGGPGREDI
jgi:DNA-directed RNA polymerase specialized sigma subunit